MEANKKAKKGGLWRVLLFGFVLTVLYMIHNHKAESVNSVQNAAPKIIDEKAEIILDDGNGWSEPAVATEDQQGMDFYIIHGRATAYEVRDAKHPEVVYKFHPGEAINTSGHRISKWQWRVSGQTIEGPVVLEYTKWH